MLAVSSPACAGSAEESAKLIREDDGDAVGSGLGSSGRLQAAVSHRRADVRLSDAAAQPGRGGAAVQRGPQPESVCQGTDCGRLCDGRSSVNCCSENVLILLTVRIPACCWLYLEISHMHPTLHRFLESA